MTDESLQLLESPDPALRRQAILDVGRAGDRRALPALLKIYKTDPDPVIRELAFKAGRRIKSLMDTAAQTAVSPSVVERSPAPSNAVSYTNYAASAAPNAPPSPSFAVSASTPAAPILPPIRKAISPRDRSMAKGRLDTAITHKIQGNAEKAIVMLADALHLNPDLETDGLAINLATALTGISAAAEAMTAVKTIAASAAAKPKRAENNSAGSESSLMNTLLEVLIYFALLVVLWLVVVLILSRQSDTAIQSMVPAQAAQGRAVTNPFRGLTLVIMMVVIVIAAGVSTLITLFSNTIYWAIGIPLGGSGDWSRVVSAMIRVEMGYTVVSAVIAGLMYFVLPASVKTEAYVDLGRLRDGVNLLQFLNGVGGLCSLGAMAYYLGLAHHFGFLKGLATIFAGTVLQCCACFALVLAMLPSMTTPSIQ